MHVIKKVVLAAAAIFAAGMVYAGNERLQSDSINKAEWVEVEYTGINNSISVKGTVIELNRRELFPQYMSRVTGISVKKGQKVSKGDILMTFELEAGQAFASAFYNDIQNRADELSQGVLFEPNLPVKNIQGEKYHIISPINGTIMDIDCSLGEVLSGAFPCIVVSDLTDLAVRAGVGEDKISEIELGMSCLTKVSSLSDKNFIGRITEIEPYASSGSFFDQSGEVETDVTISLSGSVTELKPGYTASTTVMLGEEKNKIVIPYECIGQDDNGEYAFVVDSRGYLVRAQIETGRELEDGTEIVSGLTRGDIVIIDPIKYKEGERVKLN